MKILITRQAFDDPGGISNYFACLKDKLSFDSVQIEVGKRIHEAGFPAATIRLLKDYFKYFIAINSKNILLVHLNISLNIKSVIRDSIFVLIAILFKKKVLLFIHGWEDKFASFIRKYFLIFFKLVFGSVSAFIVLSTSFKKSLLSWGFKKPIYVERTFVDDKMISSFDMKEITKRRLANNNFNILFLSRIIREKGIFETIRSIALLQNEIPNITLTIAGVGDDLGEIRFQIKKNNIHNIIFTGYVVDQAKIELFENSHLFCLPSHQEGLPIALLEAMAFGLPVITCAVGGLRDIFKNEVNGFFVEINNPKSISDFIRILIYDTELYKRISKYNYCCIRDNFLASQGAKRLEYIYQTLIDS